MTQKHPLSRRSGRDGSGPGGPRPGLLRRTMGHSPLASFMLVLLPLGSLALVAVFLFYTNRMEEPGAGAARPVADPVSREQVRMVNPRVSRFDRKARSYVVTAATAEQDRDNPALVLLDKVRIELNPRSKLGKVEVTSQRGSYDADRELLKLVGNVRVVTGNGYSANLSSADVYLDEGRLTSEEPVVLYMPFGSLHANGVELTDKGEVARFVRRTRVVIRPKGDTG